MSKANKIVLPEHLRMFLPKDGQCLIVTDKDHVNVELTGAVFTKLDTKHVSGFLGKKLKTGDKLVFSENGELQSLIEVDNSVRNNESTGRTPVLTKEERGFW